MAEDKIDVDDVPLRDQLHADGWKRGACIDLKANSAESLELMRQLPELLVEKVGVSERAYMMPLLYECALIDDDYEGEPWVPVLVFWGIKDSVGNYLNGKNPRVYHFELVVNGERSWFEGSASGLWVVCRRTMQQVSVDPSVLCEEDTVRRLLRWSASRVTRSVFPDEWNSKMEKIRKRLEVIWKSEAYAQISHVFLSLKVVGNVYNAKVILSVPDKYVKEVGQRKYFGQGGRSEELSTKIRTTMSAAVDVIVETVAVIPESQLTLGMLREYESWPLDYYSFRRAPEGQGAVI